MNARKLRVKHEKQKNAFFKRSLARVFSDRCRSFGRDKGISRTQVRPHRECGWFTEIAKSLAEPLAETSQRESGSGIMRISTTKGFPHLRYKVNNS